MNMRIAKVHVQRSFLDILQIITMHIIKIVSKQAMTALIAQTITKNRSTSGLLDEKYVSTKVSEQKKVLPITKSNECPYKLTIDNEQCCNNDDKSFSTHLFHGPS